MHKDQEHAGIQQVRAVVEPPLQIFRHAAQPGYVVEPHHENSEENHRRDGAGPIPMVRHHPVLRAHRDHADNLERAEIGGHERQPRNPGWQRTAREKEVLGCFHPVLEPIANADDEENVCEQDGEIDGGEMHEGDQPQPASANRGRASARRVKSAADQSPPPNWDSRHVS